MPSCSRGNFLAGLAGSVGLTGCAASTLQVLDIGRDSSSSRLLSSDGKTGNEIQRLIDYYVGQNEYFGRTCIAVVVGAISPKLSKATLFFGGNPVKARHHREALPLDGDTPFEIGSITKVFNSWVFAYRGKDYAATIGDYAKIDLPKGIAEIKIDNVANYSSGFPTDDEGPDWWGEWLEKNDGGSLSLRDLEKGLHGKQLPQCVPGKFYSYSNFAWGLMGLASIGVERGDDPFARWEAAIKELRSHIGLSESTVPASLSTASVIPAGYSGSQLLPENYTYLENSWPTLGGFGDLVSTGHDMMAWLSYNMGIGGRDYPLLKLQQSPRTVWSEQEPPQPPPSSSYQFPCPTPISLTQPVVTARGWFVDGAFRGKILVKNGDVTGFGSWMGFKPWVESRRPSETGVFVLTNNYPTKADQLGNDIMNILLV